MVHYRHRDEQIEQIEDSVSRGESAEKSSGTAPKGDAGGNSPEPSNPMSTRNRAVIALLALTVVAAIIWATSRTEDPAGQADPGAIAAETSRSDAADSTAGPSVPSSAPSTTVPTATGGDANELPVPLEPVPLDETAEFGDAVSAELVDLAAIQAEGQAAGEISGPAIRVMVRLINGTGQPLSLDGVTVIMYFGAELTPAPSISDPETIPFRGSLASGQSAEGGYTFSIAEEDRDNISVTVSHAATSAIVVFNGSFG